MKEKTVCFSGHRPEKLPKENQLIADIKSLIYFSIYRSINEGYTYFMSGLARGIDIWAGLEVLEFKRKNPKIKLISVKPFETHGYNFCTSDSEDMKKIICNSDRIISTSEHYCRSAYKIRNCYMIDHSDKLIAFVSDYSRSGTGQTIRYAKKSGIKTEIIDLNELSENYYKAIEKI